LHGIENKFFWQAIIRKGLSWKQGSFFIDKQRCTAHGKFFDSSFPVYTQQERESAAEAKILSVLL
jgi:hypothetical protein